MIEVLRFYEIYQPASWRQMDRERTRAEAKREAALCDCWKRSGPICAACQRRQRERERSRAMGR